MKSFAATYENFRSSLKKLHPDPIILVTLLLSAPLFIYTTQLTRTGSVLETGSDTHEVSPLFLVAATNVGAEAFSATGRQAKLINETLPFDQGPVEAAPPFVIGRDKADYSRALLCLRAAVYHEAGFEPPTGRRAVAQVILNRVRHAAFPKSVCDVVYQGAASPVCQFSFACDKARHRPVAAAAWQEAKQIAEDALAGQVEPSVGTSTHYHADYVTPRWASLLTKVSKAGTHIFYRWPGAWGQAAAFSRRYMGEQASEIGRIMELNAATEEAAKLLEVRGVALVEIREGNVVAPEVVRGVYNRGAAVRAGDVWDVGANETLIAATLIARLVERRLLSWDSPLREIFPDLAPYMRSDLQSVTLVEVFADRSILAAKNNPAFASALTRGAHPLIVHRAHRLEKVLNSATIRGTSNSRRDPALVIAAAAAEGATGRRYQDLVGEEIFKPLDMQSAGFAILSGSGAKPGGKHVADGPNLLAPPGRVQMNLRDFSIFLADQMYGELSKGKLLSARAYRHLHAPSSVRKKGDNDAVRFPAPFRGPLLRKSFGHYWIIGAHLKGNQTSSLLIVPIPKGQNGLRTLGKTLNTNGNCRSIVPANVRTGWRADKRLGDCAAKKTYATVDIF